MGSHKRQTTKAPTNSKRQTETGIYVAFCGGFEAKVSEGIGVGIGNGQGDANGDAGVSVKTRPPR